MNKPVSIRKVLGRTALVAAGAVASLSFPQERVPALALLTPTAAYDPIRYASAFIVAEAWRELGFEVNVRPTEFNTLLGQFYDEQDFDAAVVGWSGRVDRLDPQHFLATLDSRQSELGANNPGGYNNPEYDAPSAAPSRPRDIRARPP